MGKPRINISYAEAAAQPTSNNIERLLEEEILPKIVQALQNNLIDMFPSLGSFKMPMAPLRLPRERTGSVSTNVSESKNRDLSETTSDEEGSSQSPVKKKRGMPRSQPNKCDKQFFVILYLWYF
ncbi:unnamed protein product [Acanthoscelides obtectus]|uniref:Uncharacterized protein n=1 Tax=Acanthoscelides obtectus TaxID=200917 RepID=A0A9P0K1E1_ACAOB|nr:unnamed protein product [Acanthoscelides obtectus]CAK1669744.1 hypothetical protein AOBTE_LOCUS27220 [Acanthoscelides obtectus]